jgi:uncharacterized protein YqiB (DUF1249 family)
MSAFHPAEKSFWLQQVCESNYRKLARLVPDLPRIEASAAAEAGNKPTLHLRLLERSRYTLTLELTHAFPPGPAEALEPLEPAVRIRVCLDAKTAEALCDHCRPGVLDALKAEASARQVLDYKWGLNYFLARWLDHCLSSDYRFGAARSSSAPPPRGPAGATGPEAVTSGKPPSPRSRRLRSRGFRRAPGPSRCPVR